MHSFTIANGWYCASEYEVRSACPHSIAVIAVVDFVGMFALVHLAVDIVVIVVEVFSSLLLMSLLLPSLSFMS